MCVKECVCLFAVWEHSASVGLCVQTDPPQCLCVNDRRIFSVFIPVCPPVLSVLECEADRFHRLADPQARLDCLLGRIRFLVFSSCDSVASKAMANNI